MMLKPVLAWSVNEVNPDRVNPRVAAIVAKTIGVDTHNHADVPFTAAEVPGPAIDLADAMKRSGLSAICMTFAVDRPVLRNPGDAYKRFRNGLASMDKHPALNIEDLRTAHEKHQPTVIQSVEGVSSSDTNARNDPGSTKNRGRIGEGTNEAWPDQQVGFYYAVVDALLNIGFTEDEIGKVGGGNFCRVFDAATAGHR